MLQMPIAPKSGEPLHGGWAVAKPDEPAPQGGGKVPLQPNYVVSQTEEELVLRNYEGKLFHYRNPDGYGRSEPASAASLLNSIELQFDPKGADNADRIIVRS